MKLSNKQLKQIVKKELRSVLDEVMVDPMDLAQIALQDPQVDEKIKVLLQDPNNRNYGIQLLTLMYPDDYPAEDARSYQASDEYIKTFDKEMQQHKDTATMETAYTIIESHPEIQGQINDHQGSVVIRSHDKEAMLAAMADFERQFPKGGFFNFPGHGYEDERLVSEYGNYFAAFQLTEKPTKTPRSFSNMYRRLGHDAKILFYKDDMVMMFIDFLEQAMKLTTKQLKQIIKEELSHIVQESNNFTEKFKALFSGDAELIIQGFNLAYSLGMTPEDLPFEKLDLSKENIPDHADLLRVAETVLETYGDHIVSYLRIKLVNAMEKGLRRRLEAGMTTGLNYPSDLIRRIIKNELTAHQRKINVIGEE